MSSAVSLPMLTDFLKRHENFSLFLLNNLELQGAHLTEHPHSGNFHTLYRNGQISCVFCLTRIGNLLLTAEGDDLPLEAVIQTCGREPIALKGLLTEWSLGKKLWAAFKQAGLIEHTAQKSVLYSLDLQKERFAKDSRVRNLRVDDFDAWYASYRAYIDELNVPPMLNRREQFVEFGRRCSQQIIWGLFEEGILKAIANLNAKAGDLGQLGGVYTVPGQRRKGLARALVSQIAADARDALILRKLIIFTDEQNYPARHLYQSLSCRQVGYYGIFFGQQPPPRAKG